MLPIQRGSLDIQLAGFVNELLLCKLVEVIGSWLMRWLFPGFTTRSPGRWIACRKRIGQRIVDPRLRTFLTICATAASFFYGRFLYG
ncbi:MAG TPA: hypothetical protein VF089_02160, partial [Candidatus Binatia bacterium]